LASIAKNRRTRIIIRTIAVSADTAVIADSADTAVSADN
jgi:hypothetical protein